MHLHTAGPYIRTIKWLELKSPPGSNILPWAGCHPLDQGDPGPHSGLGHLPGWDEVSIPSLGNHIPPDALNPFKRRPAAPSLLAPQHTHSLWSFCTSHGLDKSCINWYSYRPCNHLLVMNSSFRQRSASPLHTGLLEFQLSMFR